jgi:hypothetical protein
VCQRERPIDRLKLDQALERLSRARQINDSVSSYNVAVEAEFVGCSKRTIWRALNAIDNPKPSELRATELNLESQAVVWNHKGRLKSAWREAVGAGFFERSYRTFVRALGRLPIGVQAGITKGEDAMRAVLPYLDLPRPTRRMEVVEIDHALLPDIVVYDPVSGRRGHPWITIVIDVYSRMVLGFSLTLAIGPNGERLGATSESAFVALADALMNYGRFEWLRFDQGADFMGPVAEAITRLGIKAYPSPAHSPWTKPYVERFFQTLKRDLLPTCPGYGITLEEAA